MNQMLKNYWMALTHPSTATFEQLKASVKTSHTLIGLIVAGLIAGLIGLAQALLKTILSGGGVETLVATMIGGVIGLVLSPIIVLGVYYIGQAIVWVIAKLFGGKGGLGLQASLNATFAVPLGIIGVILGAIPFIPFIGQVLSALVNLYALFPLTLSLSVVHEYSKVKAFLTWFVIFVVVFLCTICFLVLLGPQIASVFQQIIRGLETPTR